jgi:hypothetical protein
VKKRKAKDGFHRKAPRTKGAEDKRKSAENRDKNGGNGETLRLKAKRLTIWDLRIITNNES